MEVKQIEEKLENISREINYAQAQLAIKKAEMEEYITIHGKEQNCTTARAMKNEMIKLEDEIDELMLDWQAWDDTLAEIEATAA